MGGDGFFDRGDSKAGSQEVVEPGAAEARVGFDSARDPACLFAAAKLAICLAGDASGFGEALL